MTSLSVSRPTRLGGVVLGVFLSYCLSVGAAPGRADGFAAPGAWILGLELQERSFDTMSAGDARPAARGDAGVRLSVDRLMTARWSLGLSGHFGGTWFDWADPLYNTAGKIEDTAWGVRFAGDRVFALGRGGLAFAGVGIEYGEARSWMHALGAPPGSAVLGQRIDDEGPRCYSTGAYARFVVMTPVWRRTALCAQISQSYYGAHATDPPFGTRFDWLGRSIAVSAGLRFQLARGRTADAE